MNWLTDTRPFLPRASCGNGWDSFQITWYVVSELMIILAYMWIPAAALLALYRYRAKLHRMDMRRLYYLFGAFIFLCGVTHLTNVFVFRWAAYRLYTLLTMLAGLVSLAAARYTWPVLRMEFERPLREELIDARTIAQEELLRRSILEKELSLRNVQLTKDVNRLTEIIETSVWVHDREKVIAEMAATITRIRNVASGPGR